MPIGDVADRLFTAIEHGDDALLVQLFADDIAVWRTGATGDDDKDRALRVLRWFINRTTERRYEVLDRRVFDDGAGFVQQHILHATRTGTGEAFALRACLVVTLSADNRISRIDEYLDPAELAALLH